VSANDASAGPTAFAFGKEDTRLALALTARCAKMRRFAARCTLDKSAQLVRLHSCPKPLAAAAMRHGRKWTKNLRSYGRILVTKGVQAAA
jgi:hypothetical protein